ncbi:MAG: D-alanine--D-alanine ligase [Bacteroidales bacterium]|jgi:D-alanine-D-alanine ligase|nr:D-alanine--D-alanine ligase [Bacteroidales bacterium]MDD4058306.1 D-alanine--D-alanine ligase [Bacteroidales bacterium]
MKKIIALVYGGNSSEAEVSVKSGKHVASHIDKDLFEVHEVLVSGNEWSVVTDPDNICKIDKGDFSFTLDGIKVNFDVALVMIHGTPGENGLLQAYFEMIGMKYTTCPSTVSAITFDKYACKCYLKDTGIALAKELFLHKWDVINEDEIVAKLGLPLFVKPNVGGSSFGVTKVKERGEIRGALDAAFSEADSILAEEFIDGREMTNGVYESDGKLVRLPVTEIIPDNEFFDYEAKYLGASKEVCPAVISNELSKRIQDISHSIYRYLGCKGVVRVDYIVRGDDIFFLEINTVPGMTEMSLVPQQIRAAGMTIKDFITKLIYSSV